MNFTKTHKFLYILDGMFLFLHNTGSLIDERPNPWPYGPAYPKVQDMMKKITPKSPGNFETAFYDLEKAAGVQFLTNKVLDMFGDYTSTKLTEWSHKEGSPWSQTRKDKNNDCNAVINREIMTQYFKTNFRKVDVYAKT